MLFFEISSILIPPTEADEFIADVELIKALNVVLYTAILAMPVESS